jgi:hypothetical protein
MPRSEGLTKRLREGTDARHRSIRATVAVVGLWELAVTLAKDST